MKKKEEEKQTKTGRIIVQRDDAKEKQLFQLHKWAKQLRLIRSSRLSSITELRHGMEESFDRRR